MFRHLRVTAFCIVSAVLLVACQSGALSTPSAVSAADAAYGMANRSDGSDTRVGQSAFARGYEQEKAGQFGQATASYETALAEQVKVLGPVDPALIPTYSALGRVLNRQHLYQSAVRQLENGLFVRKKTMGNQSLSAASGLQELATSYQSLGDTFMAVELLEQALQIKTTAWGEDDARVQRLQARLTRVRNGEF